MPLGLAQLFRLSTVLSITLASLVVPNAWASAVQGKPNPDCPQFAPAGFPFPTDAKVAGRSWHVCHKAYSSYVDPATRAPLWSVEKIAAANLQGEEPRTNDFRPDPDVPRTAQAHSSRDYARSGYDQGHLAPAGDFKSLGPDVMSESFYFSNIVPQNAHNNRHAWQKLEIFTRQWAQSRGLVYVFTGPLYSQGKSLGFLGESKIAIPTHMFKVVIDYQRMESVAFVLPNEPVTPDGLDAESSRGGSLKQWEDKLSRYTVSIRELESWSGLRFNSGLDEARRSVLHSAKSPMWSGRAPRKSK